MYNKGREGSEGMIQSKKKWHIQKPDDQIVQTLTTGLGLSTMAAKILAARGFTSIEQATSWLHMDEQAIHDPFLMNGMDEAVFRIEQALDEGEKILVYGDYDADGVTSTKVLLDVLYDLGADVIFKIPNRFTHGYGPHIDLFQEAYDEGVRLIITVDNGISAVDQVRYAKDLGMDVIITDHHEPGDVLPEADVILHPRVPEDSYPFGELAGVGVAFKLAHALYGELPEHLFEYVAIGTVADLVPLEGENRYFVKRGLEALRHSYNPWVHAMCEVSGQDQQKIDEESIGFLFGPRLNAVGRLGEARPAVELLMSDDETKAMALAKTLNDANTDRKDLVKTITDEAIAMIESDDVLKNSLVLVVAQKGWNPGVVGIVASRLVEEYYKPTIVLCIDEEKGTAKGSARSIEGYHLYNELAKNRDLVPHFGGHPMAAGMTFPAEHVDELRRRLDTQARACLTEEQLQAKLFVDIPLTLEEITVDAIEDIAKLGPFGMHFAKPIYALEQMQIASMKKIGAAHNHLKLEITDGASSIDAVSFNNGHLADELTYGVNVSFVGDVSINEWQGRKKPQFKVSDVQSEEWQLFDIRGIRQTSRWLQQLPIEDVQFIAFEDVTITHYASLLPKPILHVLRNDEEISTHGFVVLLDLPQNVQMLQTLLLEKKPARIYAHFFVKDSHYFSGMPSREQFAWFFKLLKQNPNLHWREHFPKIATQFGIQEDLLKFMTKVFFELEFVRIDKGLISVNPSPQKMALTEAPAYKERQSRIELEQLLLYAPYAELKQWFTANMHNNNM